MTKILSSVFAGASSLLVGMIFLILYLFLVTIQDGLYAGEKRNVKGQSCKSSCSSKLLEHDKKISLIEAYINERNSQEPSLKSLDDVNDAPISENHGRGLGQNCLAGSCVSTEETRGMNFEAFTGILLTCVAILVTILGVGIAILALWGFSNIKKAAAEAAVLSSEKQLRDTINTGHFNDVINRAVEKVIYRGILSEENFPKEDREGSDEL